MSEYKIYGPEFEAMMLDVIGQAVIATDLKGVVTYWNKAAEKMYGWSRQDAIGKNILGLTPSSQSQEEAEKIFELLTNGISWSGELLVKGKDGREFPAQVTDSPILDSDGKVVGVVGISSDISERKGLEDLLEKSNSLARIGSYEIDCSSMEVYWSSMTKKIHGVDENFVPTFEKAISFYAEGDQKKILQGFQAAMEKNIELNFEGKIKTASGNFCWVRVIGEPQWKEGRCLKIRGSFQDIDEAKKTELEVLRASEEKEKILESIGDAFFALNHEWIVTYWNSQAEKILKCSRHKILGEKLIDFFDIRSTSFEYHYKIAAEEKVTQHFEAFYEGTNSWYNVSAYPSAEGLSIFFKDVTQQKEANSKLVKLNEDLQTYANELVTANKSLEQFSYIISHNLRAPVANILGLADLLEDHSSSQHQKKVFEGLVSNVKRLDNVMRDLNQILQVKSAVTQRRAHVNLDEIVLSVKDSLQNLIEKAKVEIRTDFRVFNEVYTVPGYLYSIFYNLIFNSIKYRREGVPPVITIKSAQVQDEIHFLFEDNGMGIDLLRKGDEVFGLYKRFHPHVEGKGIGLYMVKTQVELLGGRVSVTSEVNSGTTFAIKWGKALLKRVQKDEEIYSS